MKKLLSMLAFSVLVSPVIAQDENEEDPQKGKFRKDNIFIGGGVNLGFGSNTLQLGITPEIGYSITKWLDAGVLFNIIYQTENQTNITGYKLRQLQYGTGGFVRIWPVRFLHLTVQPEHNWIRQTAISQFTGNKESATFNAGSVLAGIGYGSRNVGGSYQYLTVMIDLMDNVYSPYRDQYNKTRPVIKAGFGFYLRPSKKK